MSLIDVQFPHVYDSDQNVSFTELLQKLSGITKIKGLAPKRNKLNMNFLSSLVIVLAKFEVTFLPLETFKSYHYFGIQF